MLKTNLAFLILFTSSVAVAEEVKPWQIELDLGAIATSGNTETNSVHAKVDAKQNFAKWKNQYIVSSLFKNDEVTQDDDTKVKEKTAEKYLASAKSAYLLDGEEDKSYLFGIVSYTHDKFGSYKTYSTAAVGYGDWLYSAPSLNWFLEAGPGYFRGEKVLQPEFVGAPTDYEIEQGALLRVASELEWKFSQTAAFKQVVSVEASSDNTRILSETSVAASITNAMQMKFAVAIANDSKVADDKEKTDTMTSATLVYKF